MPIVTTTVQLPSAYARSLPGVDGVIGFTAVGDGDEEGFVGVGSAEREGATGVGASAYPLESEPQPLSAVTRPRTRTMAAEPRAADNLAVRRRADGGAFGRRFFVEAAQSVVATMQTASASSYVGDVRRGP